MHQPVDEGVADNPRAELLEALAHANRTAKRCPRVVGCDALPSRWSLTHDWINRLLTDLEALA